MLAAQRHYGVGLRNVIQKVKNVTSLQKSFYLK